MSQSKKPFGDDGTGTVLPHAQAEAPCNPHFSSASDFDYSYHYVPQSSNSSSSGDSYFGFSDTWSSDLNYDLAYNTDKQEEEIFAQSYSTPSLDCPELYTLQRAESGPLFSSHAASTYPYIPCQLQSSAHYLYPTPQNSNRRRSLSQGDAEMATQATNPTLLRLRAQRSRSAGPEDQLYGVNKPNSCHRRGRSASYLPRTMMRRSNLSAGTFPRSHPRLDGMLPTPSGTPLSMVSSHTARARTRDGPKIPMQLTGPVLRHMSHAEQLNKSRHVIEVGAMVVLNQRKDNQSSYQGPGKLLHGHSGDVDMLKKLEDLGDQLRLEHGNSEEAMRGYEMIHKALLDKTSESIGLSEHEGEHIIEDPLANNEGVGSAFDPMVASNEIFSAEHNDMYEMHALETQGLMTFVVRDHPTVEP